MQEPAIQVNPGASLSVRKVGRDQTPLIMVDAFLAEPRGLIEHGCLAAEYGPDGTSLYPGLRAKLPRNYVRSVLQHLYRLLFQVYAIPTELGMKPVNAVYSLIATPEHALQRGQCNPHFDSNQPFYLAILHYLNDGDFCDTGLFRHRPTGLERVLEPDIQRYHQAREAHRERHGEPRKAYIKGSNDEFELYDRIEYRANRLVVYPGCLLHSGLVNPAVDIDPDPRSGRLTANIFVDCVPLESAS